MAWWWYESCGKYGVWRGMIVCDVVWWCVTWYGMMVCGVVCDVVCWCSMKCGGVI